MGKALWPIMGKGLMLSWVKGLWPIMGKWPDGPSCEKGFITCHGERAYDLSWEKGLMAHHGKKAWWPIMWKGLYYLSWRKGLMTHHWERPYDTWKGPHHSKRVLWCIMEKGSLPIMGIKHYDSSWEKGIIGVLCYIYMLWLELKPVIHIPAVFYNCMAISFHLWWQMIIISGVQFPIVFPHVQATSPSSCSTLAMTWMYV